MTPIGRLDEPARQALARILEAPTFEVLPLTRTPDDVVAALAPGTTLSVSASPNRGQDPTLAVATELAARGFRAIPHLAARMVRDRAHLRAILDQLAAAGIDRALVVGGDATDAGTYPDALTLLRELAELGSPLTEIGIAGYPQGHPRIAPELLHEALLAKAPFAAYVTTQLCFDAAAIRDWAVRIRTDGVDLPIHLGVAGLVGIPRLLEIGARIGVSDAGRYLLRQGGLVRPLLRFGAYRPDPLLADLAPALAGEGLGIRRLHAFTFNQIAATETWRRQLLAGIEA